jgi:hypothetical protein
MAKSPSHKFGQIIGDLLEIAVEPILQKFAQEYGLYLDKKGLRAARKGSKVSLRDLNGNIHDLDFVLERHGSITAKGTPVAFIETAWRRNTKHSKNKAQEIQGAIAPLLETYKDYAPFAGTILAGDFTDNALIQLRSLGFTVLYFPYDNIVRAFRLVNIDAASDKDTPHSEFVAKIAAWGALPEEKKLSVAEALIDIHKKDVAEFIEALRNAVTRQVELVRVLPLYGTVFQCQSIEEAIQFIEQYDQTPRLEIFERYEVEIRYVNGDSIKANFQDKTKVIAFLRINQPSIDL